MCSFFCHQRNPVVVQLESPIPTNSPPNPRHGGTEVEDTHDQAAAAPPPLAAGPAGRPHPGDPPPRLAAAARGPHPLLRRLQGLAPPPRLRRYRAFHVNAPLLGFIFNRQLQRPRDLVVPEFVRVTPFRPRARTRDRLDWVAARRPRPPPHLLLPGHALVVWDPVTGDQWEIPEPDFNFGDWDATVLCAAHARGCDHLHCRGGPFLVAFVGTNGGDAWACVYSSEDGAWGDVLTAVVPLHAASQFNMCPTALVGNTVYFVSCPYGTLAEYDLDHQKLDFIDTPFKCHALVMPWEGGRLGYAAVQGSSLHLFSRDACPDGTSAWTECRVIDLNKLHTLEPWRSFDAAGFAEGLGVVFVSTDAGIFAINIKSGRIKKVFHEGHHTIIPYTSFYTPDHVAG
ncbi:hypothetical protein QOZ80_2AG0125000 [Eleusine coracana subsp. coracana]|nr:hypothetical protein QOZ80_2AG0125000 [Eleusine coracana subsp. coracana]